ncbi:polysaccharide pyruvyl transferase family protein [Microbacterium salsuginis]|nr:polysaccharide pyruvyl transferase family protein [Microbacterium sp. CFH 90308]
MIVERIQKKLELGRAVARKPRLLAVGSIMRLGEQGDVVWGTGINGKTVDSAVFPRFDVRAVRGPLTAEALRKFGNEVPHVFGDPALLIPHLWSDQELGIQRGTGGTVLMPNYNDAENWPTAAVDPRGNPHKRIQLLASANLVVASSLHAVVIAEAYGVPTVLVRSSREPTFKYEDYYEGTGRRLPAIASDWRSGLEASPAPPIDGWDSGKLMSSFPSDLWLPRTKR